MATASASSQSLSDRSGAPLWRELWLVAAFFALIVILSFPQVVFFGRSLLASDNYNPLDYRYSESNYGPHFTPAEEWRTRGIVPYANMSDPGSAWWQGEPNLVFFRRAILSGQFPFWDPSAACGAPAFTNMTPAMLFPPQVLLGLAGATSWQKNVYILLLFWVCGWSCYYLLRLHRVSLVASITGGLVFLFSGGVQQIAHINFMVQVVACMPLLLISTRLFLNRPSWRRSSGLAFTFAFVALASFPPLLFSAFAFTVLYFATALLLERPPQIWSVVARFAAAALLSGGMVAAYYLPTLLTVSQATHITAWYRTAGLEFLRPRALFDLLSPTAGGGSSVYTLPIMEGNASGRLYYVGAAALFLGILGLGRTERAVRPLQLAAAACTVLVLAKIFGVPPVQWVAYLPLFNSLHYALYFGIIVAFAVALLAAIGMERLIQGRVRLGMLIAGALPAAVLVASPWLFARHSGALEKIGAWRWIADYRLVVFFGAAALAIAGGSILLRRTRHGLQGAGALLALLLVIEGIVNATYPRQRRWDVFAHPPGYVTALQKMPPGSRGFIAAALNANLQSAFGIDTLDSLYTFVSTRVFELYTRYAVPPPWVFLREATALPPDPVLDRAGISWLLLRHELKDLIFNATSRRHDVVYQDDYVRIYTRGPVPRAFFSSDYVVTNRAAALEAIATAPPRQLVLENAPALPPQPNDTSDPTPLIDSSRLNSMSLHVRAPRAGFLYMADTYDSGWSASVNGAETPILVANYAFRAVPVPAGDVVVRLRYLPRGFVVGSGISVAALAIMTALFLRGSRRLQRV